MNDQLQMFEPMTCEGSRNAISSPGLVDGHTPCSLPDGLKIVKSGRDLAHANPSAWQEKEKARLTKGTFGPLFDPSSPSVDLQHALANRLRARMAGYGSPEYALTWKEWPMVSGPAICALRASARRTSGNGFTGWQTPSAKMSTSGRKMSGKPNLLGEARLAGWGTPKAMTGKYQKSRGKVCLNLEGMADLAGWSTPTTRDHKDGSGGGLHECPDKQTLEPRGSLGFWSDSIWHYCRDGKHRRISTEPALFPLANGIPGRVGILRGAGNAINPVVAAEFIKAYLEAEQDLTR